MNKIISYSWNSLKGRDRASNKDGLGIYSSDDESKYIFAMFDGVSSLPNAKHGVNIALRYLRSNYRDILSESNVDLKRIVIDINRMVRSSSYEKPYTTALLVFYYLGDDSKRKFFSIGDTRLYSISPQYVENVGVDDSGATPSVITNYLGNEQIYIEEKNEIYLDRDGDILICTDGFYSVMEKCKERFLKAFYRDSSVLVRKEIDGLICGKNLDDASYILIREKDV